MRLLLRLLAVLLSSISWVLIHNTLLLEISLEKLDQKTHQRKYPFENAGSDLYRSRWAHEPGMNTLSLEGYHGSTLKNYPKLLSKRPYVEFIKKIPFTDQPFIQEQTTMLNAQQECPALISSVRVTPDFLLCYPDDPTAFQRLRSGFISFLLVMRGRIYRAAQQRTVQCHTVIILLLQAALYCYNKQGWTVICPLLSDSVALFLPSLILLPIYLIIYCCLPRLQSFGAALALYTFFGGILWQIRVAYLNFLLEKDILFQLFNFKAITHLTEEQAYRYLLRKRDTFFLSDTKRSELAESYQSYGELTKAFDLALAEEKAARAAAAKAKQIAEMALNAPTWWDSIHSVLTCPTAITIYYGVSSVAVGVILSLLVYGSRAPGLPDGPIPHDERSLLYPHYVTCNGPGNFDYSKVYWFPGRNHKYIVGEAPGYRWDHVLTIQESASERPEQIIISIAIDA